MKLVLELNAGKRPVAIANGKKISSGNLIKIMQEGGKYSLSVSRIASKSKKDVIELAHREIQNNPKKGILHIAVLEKEIIVLPDPWGRVPLFARSGKRSLVISADFAKLLSERILPDNESLLHFEPAQGNIRLRSSLILFAPKHAKTHCGRKFSEP